MDTQGNPLTLLGIYLMGLALNLTPCVYPMMTVTLSLFGVKQDPDRRKGFAKALVYVLGMAVTYTALGTMSALTGGFFGSLLQNKFVLFGIAFLLIALAMSMFGFYTFTLPSALVNKLAGKRGAGYGGLFVSGLLVGVFAAPCIGPPVIALLAFVGTKGDPLFGLWVFFILSMGLGTPYLILGTFSHLLTRLPKSGVWLLWVERLFGVVLLTLAWFYLILAFDASYLKWLVPAALAGGGLYLGFFENSAKYTPGFVNFKRTLGVIAVTAGLVLPIFGPRQGLTWEPYTAEKVAAAQAAGRPVIMDFYADWCIPCHELDQFTYTDPAIRRVLDPFVRLKVDLTNADSEEAAAIMEKFGILGVPTILFLDPSGREIENGRVTGFISAKELLEIVEENVLQSASS